MTYKLSAKSSLLYSFFNLDIIICLHKETFSLVGMSTLAGHHVVLFDALSALEMLLHLRQTVCTEHILWDTISTVAQQPIVRATIN